MRILFLHICFIVFSCHVVMLHAQLPEGHTVPVSASFTHSDLFMPGENSALRYVLPRYAGFSKSLRYSNAVEVVFFTPGNRVADSACLSYNASALPVTYTQYKAGRVRQQTTATYNNQNLLTRLVDVDSLHPLFNRVGRITTDTIIYLDGKPEMIKRLKSNTLFNNGTLEPKSDESIRRGYQYASTGTDERKNVLRSCSYTSECGWAKPMKNYVCHADTAQLLSYTYQHVDSATNTLQTYTEHNFTITTNGATTKTIITTDSIGVLTYVYIDALSTTTTRRTKVSKDGTTLTYKYTVKAFNPADQLPNLDTTFTVKYLGPKCVELREGKQLVYTFRGQ